MSGQPKKKVTRARRARRLVAYRLRVPTLSPCPQCHSLRLPHRVCPECGYYKGREVVPVEASTGGGGA